MGINDESREIADIPGFVRYSSRLKDALGPHICSLLPSGVSVVPDFPGNTKPRAPDPPPPGEMIADSNVRA